MEIPFISKIFDRLFSDVIWPAWIRTLVASRAPKKWESCFKRAAIQSGDLEIALAIEIATQPSLQRLLLNTFKADRPIPSAKDFALSIAFELHCKDCKALFDVQLPSWQIRNLATNVRREWLQTIIDSPLLRTRFKDVRDKHPAIYMFTEAACTPEFDKVLEDRIGLVRTYFEMYSSADATEVVNVWLPDEFGEVHWGEEKCEVVEVSLNATQGADRGFFRVGYDYSLSSEDYFLHICYLDEKTLMETGEFRDRRVGKRTSRILWLR